MRTIETTKRSNETIERAIARLQKKVTLAIGEELTQDAKMGAVRQDGSRLWLEILTADEVAAAKQREQNERAAIALLPDKYTWTAGGNRYVNRSVRGWAKALAKAMETQIEVQQ